MVQFYQFECSKTLVINLLKHNLSSPDYFDTLATRMQVNIRFWIHPLGSYAVLYVANEMGPTWHMLGLGLPYFPTTLCRIWELNPLQSWTSSRNFQGHSIDWASQPRLWNKKSFKTYDSFVIAGKEEVLVKKQGFDFARLFVAGTLKTKAQLEEL